MTNDNRTNITLKKKDLSDSSVQSSLQKLGNGVNINVVDESTDTIEPQDRNTIKYLSNIKDSKTNKVSQPFIINDKKYQMVRGITPSNEIVVGVYSFDDVDDLGENIIYDQKIFEDEIVKRTINEELPNIDGKEFIEDINLKDLSGYKHFFVNINTGEIVAKFKTNREMVKSGINLGDDEDYMDVRGLKAFRLGKYFKYPKDSKLSVDEEIGENNFDSEKLQSDVKKLSKLIKNKFSVALSKLDKPIEQAQFLEAMAQEIGVPLNKLSNILNTFKDISKNSVTENRVILKKDLLKNE